MHNLYIAPVSVGNIDSIYPASMRSLFWEEGPSAATDETLSTFEKESWLNTVTLTWGQCGFSLLRHHDQRPVGTVLFAPPRFCPTTFAMPSGPISPDAVVVTSFHMDPIEVSGEAQRALLSETFRHLSQRGIRAVEAFGCSGNADESPHQQSAEADSSNSLSLGGDYADALYDELFQAIEPKGCYSTALGAINHDPGDVIKTATLLDVGMKIETPHPVHPKLRLQLNAELDWNAAVGRALDRHVAGQYIQSRQHASTRVG